MQKDKTFLTLIFLSFFNTIRSYITVEEFIEIQNNRIFGILRNISETDKFSKIKMSFNEKCPRNVEKCKIDTCSVPEISFKGQSGYIDLLKIKESFSKYTPGSQLVWRDLYRTVEDSENMTRLVSGIHFSITTHLTAFHTKLFGYFLSNPFLFNKRYKKEYKENFMELYIFIRSSISKLINNSGEIDPQVLQLSMIIKNDIEDKSLRYSSEEINRLNRKVSEDINTLKKIGIENGLSITNDMVKCLACLSCSKCRLWGTIQIKGFRSAIKSHLGIPLYDQDIIFLINFFRRLSQSVKESRRMENTKFPILSYIGIYYYQILITSTVILFIIFIALRSKRNQKIKRL